MTVVGDQQLILVALDGEAASFGDPCGDALGTSDSVVGETVGKVRTSQQTSYRTGEYCEQEVSSA